METEPPEAPEAVTEEISLRETLAAVEVMEMEPPEVAPAAVMVSLEELPQHTEASRKPEMVEAAQTLMRPPEAPDDEAFNEEL